MISIKRPRSGAPPEFLAAAQTEMIAARKHFNKSPIPKTKFKFKAYTNKTLRDAINKLASFKCAYCESQCLASQSVAIEHYRPKGEVMDSKTSLKPGYWWLAAKWENLLPACTDCNTPRYHPIDGKQTLRGKGSEFPLANPSRRATKPGQEHRELPLLLNPCSGHVDPSQHLEFVLDNKNRSLVRPKMVGKRESRKGKESIRVYGLDRPDLVGCRTLRARELLAHIKTARALQEACKGTPRNSPVRRAARSCMEEFELFISHDALYSGMCRQILEQKLPAALR
jgi:5-methylcytosine-specific restriction endonuclease McrA